MLDYLALKDQPFGAIVRTPVVEVISNTALHAPLLHAFHKHGLLVWKNESLAPQQEVDLMKLLPWDRDAPPERLYGPLGVPGADGEHYRRWRLPNFPEILCQGEGEVVSHHGVSGWLSSGKPVMEWHTDGAHELETPPIATSMYAVSTPREGGDTLFMSGAEVYARLEHTERARADTMRVQYSRTPKPMNPSGLRAKLDGEDDAIRSSETAPLLGSLYASGSAGEAAGATHPLIWEGSAGSGAHAGRRSLMVSPMWMSRLQDGNGSWIDAAGAQRWVEAALRLAVPSAYRHRWEVGDFVAWDNRWLYHSATPNDLIQPTELRLLHRIRFAGAERPQSPQGRASGTHNKDEV